MMKLKLSWLMTVLVIAVSVLVGTITLSSRASATPVMFCRDCPFPAKIADGRWLMPNGILQLEIDEQQMPGSMSHVHVVLRDVRSGDIVAYGFIVQRKNSRVLLINLTDNQGRRVKGFVRYFDTNRVKIQAKFTCEECSIGPMLQ
jgi:hypothetical protein